MAGGTYPDGFPLSPIEAINFSYFLTEQEKNEWREWLKDATSDQQLELVNTLHDIWIDNQKQAVPSGFDNQAMQGGQQSQPRPQPQQQGGFQPQQKPRQAQQPQQQRPAQQGGGVAVPKFKPQAPSPQGQAQQRPQQQQAQPQAQMAPKPQQPKPAPAQSSQQQSSNNQQKPPQPPRVPAPQTSSNKSSSITSQQSSSQQTSAEPPKKPQSEQPPKPKFTFKEASGGAKPQPKPQPKQEVEKKAQPQPKPQPNPQNSNGNKAVAPAPTSDNSKKSKFFDFSKLANKNTKSALENIYNEFDNSRQSQEELTKKLIETILEYEHVNEYFDVIAERMIDLNDVMVGQAKEISKLKNELDSTLDNVKFANDDILVRIDELEEKVERISREARTTRKSSAEKYENVTTQLSAYTSDMYKQGGLIERITLLNEKIKKLESNLNSKQNSSDSGKGLSVRERLEAIKKPNYSKDSSGANSNPPKRSIEDIQKKQDLPKSIDLRSKV